jgi:hypothetical protein
MGPASLPTPLSPMRGRSRKNELGIRCFAVLLRRSAEIGVCHRRSHRHPDPPSGGFGKGDRGRSRLFPRLPRPRRAAPRSDTWGRSLKRLRFGRSEDLSKRPIGRRPGSPARERNNLAHPSSSPPPRAEAVSSGFSEWAGQIPPRHPGVKIFRSFKPLGRRVRKGSPRSDGLKLSSRRRFDKQGRRSFSTPPTFRCGLQWISHRFVAY